MRIRRGRHIKCTIVPKIVPARVHGSMLVDRSAKNIKIARFWLAECPTNTAANEASEFSWHVFRVVKGS